MAGTDDARGPHLDHGIPVIKIACEVLAGPWDLAMARVAFRRFARRERESTVREGFPRLLGCPGLMAVGRPLREYRGQCVAPGRSPGIPVFWLRPTHLALAGVDVREAHPRRPGATPIYQQDSEHAPNFRQGM